MSQSDLGSGCSILPMDFQVGIWRVRADMGSLTSNGYSRHLSPKAMEVLAYLAERQGQVVGKEELLQALWNGVFVTDDALTRCVGELRRAFQDDAREPSVIQTIPKRGYLLLAPVTWAQAPDPPATDLAPPKNSEPRENLLTTRPRLWKSRWSLVAFACLLAAAGITTAYVIRQTRTRITHRIAVLPLTNISADSQQDYFADGMTEQLITEMAQISAWEVISRTSVMQYKRTNKSLPQIARELSADWIIEGTVQRAGARVRVTAQLIEAGRDAHLWSGSFERDVSDVLALQSDIARAVADQADLALSRQDKARLQSHRKVVPEAYDAYLTGRYFLERSEFDKAASEFELATLKDPKFALAYAYLWEADSMVNFVRDLPASERALKAAHQAMELDDTLAEAHVVAGDIKFYENWDWASGEAEFRRAVELDPNSVDAAYHYAGCLHALGRWDAALAELRRALHLDPVSPMLNNHLLATLRDAHRYDEAIAQFNRTIEIDPNSAPAYGIAGDVYELMGRDAEAIDALLKSDSLFDSSPAEMSALRRAATARGLHGYWKKRLEILLEKSKRGWVPPVLLATLAARAGEKEEALKLLEEAHDKHLSRLAWMKVSTSYDLLRSDPRFESLLHRMHYPD